jgi:hypothetical protein
MRFFMRFKILLLFLFIGSVYGDWMDRQIQADLAGIAAITPAQIDAAEQAFKDMGRAFVRVKMHPDTIDYITPTFSHPVYQTRTDYFKDFFSQMQRAYPLPHVDFIITLDDACPMLPPQSAPVFCISKEKGRKGIICIPEVWTCRDGYYLNLKEIGAQIPWENRIPIAFWRGHTTGGRDYTVESWKEMPRSKLALLSRENPRLLDCALVSFIQGTKEAEMVMRKERLFKSGCDPIIQMRHRYLIAIDGHTFSSALKWELFTGSLVLKNDSEWEEWFSNALVPYEHYVPYKLDLSDLIDQLDWVRHNDESAKKIALQGQLFAEQNLKTDSVILYTYKTLAAYSQLLKK